MASEQKNLWKKYFDLLKVLGKADHKGVLEGDKYLDSLKETLDPFSYKAFVLAMIVAYFHPDNPDRYSQSGYFAVCHFYGRCGNGCPLCVCGFPCVSPKNPHWSYIFEGSEPNDAYWIFGREYTKAYAQSVAWFSMTSEIQRSCLSPNKDK